MSGVVDQREIQARGNGCGRYPQSCVVRDLLNEAGLLRPFQHLKVLDLTYGEGRFWKLIPNAKIWAFDTRKLRWVRKPYIFYAESCENWRTRVHHLSFDLVVADPPFSPYQRGWDRRKHYEEHGEIALILNEARKASLHFNAPLLIHFMWKAVPYGFRIVTERWFQGLTRLSKMPQPSWFGVLVPRDSSPEVRE